MKRSKRHSLIPNFFTIPADLLAKTSTLPPRRLLVLAYLYSVHNPQNQNFKHVSQKKIAERVGLTVKTVRGHLAQLENQGLIKTQEGCYFYNKTAKKYVRFANSYVLPSVPKNGYVSVDRDWFYNLLQANNPKAAVLSLVTLRNQKTADCGRGAKIRYSYNSYNDLAEQTRGFLKCAREKIIKLMKIIVKCGFIRKSGIRRVSAKTTCGKRIIDNTYAIIDVEIRENRTIWLSDFMVNKSRPSSYKGTAFARYVRNGYDAHKNTLDTYIVSQNITQVKPFFAKISWRTPSEYNQPSLPDWTEAQASAEHLALDQGFPF